jgi:lantibiotic modifying enzyme
MGVITAPEVRYELSIHEEVEYDISKSDMISGIAGMIIVSLAVDIRSADPKTNRVIHADNGILLDSIIIILLSY